MKDTKELEIAEIVEQEDIEALEKDFNAFIKTMESDTYKVSAGINMDELDEISEDVIKAKEYLSSFASGEKKTIREKAYNQISSFPLIGSWAKDKIEEVQTQNIKDSSVKEVLEGIFKSFDVKKTRLLELTTMMEGMKNNLLNQEKHLGDYIVRLEGIIKNPKNTVEKMKALEMSVMAESQDKITKEMIYNNLNIIMELMEGLHYKISKTLPVIKNTLNNSLNIVGTINSIRDAVSMMNALESLSNDINKKSTSNIQSLVIDTTKSLSEGTDIEFYKESAKRNEEFNKTLLEARKEHIKTTIDNYESLKQIGIDSSNQIQYRQEEEAKALGLKIESMKEGM
jgi:hypothetical protein